MVAIPTWQQRMGGHYAAGNVRMRPASEFMQAEIDDLRAAYVAGIEPHMKRCDEMRDALFEEKLKGRALAHEFADAIVDEQESAMTPTCIFCKEPQDDELHADDCAYASAKKFLAKRSF